MPSPPPDPTRRLWLALAVVNLATLAVTLDLESAPFQLCCAGLGLLYASGPRSFAAGWKMLTAGALTTAVLTAESLGHVPDAAREWLEIPLVALLFLAALLYERGLRGALAEVESLATERAGLLEEQKRLLQDVAHELRTPVTIAAGHLQLIQRYSDHATPEVEIALDELSRLGHIIDQLLLLAQGERAGSPTEIDVPAFVEDLFLRWSEVAPRSYRLGTVTPGTVRADQHTLRIALDALLENAVRHTGVGERIELRARGAADGVVIDVADGGSGIPEEALGRIFERFGRADGAREGARAGSGLGLAIVAAVADAHGGRCTVSTSTSGSTFSLHLPEFSPSPAEVG